jgi:hypothetical protein
MFVRLKISFRRCLKVWKLVRLLPSSWGIFSCVKLDNYVLRYQKYIFWVILSTKTREILKSLNNTIMGIKWENKCIDIVLLGIDIVNYSYNVSAWSMIFCLSFKYVYIYYSSYVSITDKWRSLYESGSAPFLLWSSFPVSFTDEWQVDRKEINGSD